MELNLKLDFTSQATIDGCFTRIANDLFNTYKLILNGSEYLFTEIEFYLFVEDVHADKSTHKHKIPVGHWRAHSQGLDISLGFDDKTYDGGILVRGIKKEKEYINGPRRVVAQIFQEFGSVFESNSGIRLVESKHMERSIKRTTRVGITEKNSSGFSERMYNFYCEKENWNMKHYSAEIMKHYK